jgi:hypothetical protein
VDSLLTSALDPLFFILVFLPHEFVFAASVLVQCCLEQAQFPPIDCRPSGQSLAMEPKIGLQQSVWFVSPGFA